MVRQGSQVPRSGKAVHAVAHGKHTRLQNLRHVPRVIIKFMVATTVRNVCVRLVLLTSLAISIEDKDN